MTINDAEYNEVYDFEGLFPDHFEADRFLTENKAVGNTIIIHRIEMMDVDANFFDRLYR
jgi:hypothetical protein